jgi:integrase
MGKFGLSKRCRCPRRMWTKGCRHSWHYIFKWKGRRYRAALDDELRRHVNGKTEALKEVEKIYDAVRDGTFGRESAETLTLRQLGDRYFKKYVSLKTGRPLGRNERYRWNVMIEAKIGGQPLGDCIVSDLRKHHVETFVDANRVERIVTIVDAKGNTYQAKRGGVVSTNRCLGRLKAFLNWAIEREYLAENPALRVHKLREFERERRLEPGEEERLRALTRDDWLWRLRIVAALETGCRIGEILSVQFKQLRWDLNELHLSNRTTKGLRTRYVPLSQELRAMLELRRHDPDGEEFTPDAYAFGNEVGERLKNYQKAWSTLRLRAVGHGPHWGPNGRFLPCCREQLAKMNLHMHDLRREAGSRLLERGADLHTVQLFLDHANISTSSRYLKPSKLALHTTIHRIDAQRRESGEAAKWEQELAEMQKNLQQGPQKGPQADKIVRQREAGNTVTPPRINRLGA